MRRTAERAVALLTIALTAAVTPAAGATLWDTTTTGASAANGPAVISYYEEIPCPPTAGDPGRRRSIRKRVHRKRPHVIKAKAAVPRPVVKRVAPVRPVVHRVVHRRPKRALPRVTRIAALTLPKRCTVLHRDRLTFASLALAPREASDFSPSPDPVGVAVGPQVLAPLVTGGAPFAPTPTLASGGGGPGTTVTQVSGAPEPDAWALMILGVGMAGAFLRRRPRLAAAA